MTHPNPLLLLSHLPGVRTQKAKPVQYEVLTRSQGNLEAKGNLEQLIRDKLMISYTPIFISQDGPNNYYSP